MEGNDSSRGGQVDGPLGDKSKDMELWLFTAEFPFGSGESFLENELPTLAKRFRRVRLFPMHRIAGVRPLPPGVVLEEPFNDPYRPASPALLWKHRRTLWLLLKSLFKDLGPLLLKDGRQRELFSRMRQLVYRLSVFERDVLPTYDPGSTILYSYWSYDWATILGMLRVRHPQVTFICRAHGFDLYEHQHDPPVIPFRRFQLEQMDRMFCVSQAGLDHMRTKHPAHVVKYEMARLGTRDHGVAPVPCTGRLEVLSCSFVIPRKRVHLIAEALARTTVAVRWTHFGDGEMMADLRERVGALPTHIQVDLRGPASNTEIMSWYARNGADVFILTSRLEGGVAVVLQEAVSFGIPVIATDSGGVRDIVNRETGVLLPNAMDPVQLAALLDGFRNGPMASLMFRAGVRSFWERHYKAEVSYDRFCDRLLELHRDRQR